MAVNLFWFFIFPGLLFMAVAGGLLSWFDRKITARVQFRKGPPLLQPFYDFFKLLLVKETILPKQGSSFVFLLAPLLALFGATMAGLFILLPLFNIETGFEGRYHSHILSSYPAVVLIYHRRTCLRQPPGCRRCFTRDEADHKL